VLGVSVEIQAAIVGGVISGGVVLLGVFLTEGLNRRSARYEELRRATRTIIIRLPIALLYLSASPPDEQRLDIGSTGWTIDQEVVIALVGVDIASRPRWTRNRKDVRLAHDEISARLHAAYFIWQTRHEVVTNAQFLAVSGLGAELSTAVFGEREIISALIDQYLRDGLPAS
jgi:hypothetical protein